VGEGVRAVEDQAPPLEIDDAIAKGEEFVEAQIVGSHQCFILQRCISLCNVWV